MNITTYLISGAGNTFHIINLDDEGLDPNVLIKTNQKKITNDLCKTIPADGVIFLKKQSENYVWFFYNNDSSDAEMCGNATRCVGFYIKNILNKLDNQWKLNTTAGEVLIKFKNETSFEVQMTKVNIVDSGLGFYCDTGVPHLVIELDHFDKYKNLKTEAQKLRFHKEFEPRGTNVTYVFLEKELNKVKAISYERGVEDFTLACGTGAMAAAAFNMIKRGVFQTDVEMPGGVLKMDLRDMEKPKMIGPAVQIGKFEYEFTS